MTTFYRVSDSLRYRHPYSTSSNNRGSSTKRVIETFGKHGSYKLIDDLLHLASTFISRGGMDNPDDEAVVQDTLNILRIQMLDDCIKARLLLYPPTMSSLVGLLKARISDTVDFETCRVLHSLSTLPQGAVECAKDHVLEVLVQLIQDSHSVEVCTQVACTIEKIASSWCGEDVLLEEGPFRLQLPSTCIHTHKDAGCADEGEGAHVKNMCDSAQSISSSQDQDDSWNLQLLCQALIDLIKRTKQLKSGSVKFSTKYDDSYAYSHHQLHFRTISSLVQISRSQRGTEAVLIGGVLGLFQFAQLLNPSHCNKRTQTEAARVFSLACDCNLASDFNEETEADADITPQWTPCAAQTELMKLMWNVAMDDVGRKQCSSVLLPYLKVCLSDCASWMVQHLTSQLRAPNKHIFAPERIVSLLVHFVRFAGAVLGTTASLLIYELAKRYTFGLVKLDGESVSVIDKKPVLMFSYLMELFVETFLSWECILMPFEKNEVLTNASRDIVHALTPSSKEVVYHAFRGMLRSAFLAVRLLCEVPLARREAMDFLMQAETNSHAWCSDFIQLLRRKTLAYLDDEV